MLLLDANLLIYAVSADLPEHAAARAWLDDQLNGTDRVGLPWHSLLAFLRITSNPRVLERPLPLRDGWDVVAAWLGLPTTWIPGPGERHAEILGELLPAARSHDLVADAHLCAIAVEHGLTVASSDGDFARFETVRWDNPLAPRR